MKKRIIICIMFIVSLVCCSECGLWEYQYPLFVENNSGYTIDCFFAIDDELAPFAPNIVPDPRNYLLRGVKPKTYSRFLNKIKWEVIFSDKKSDTISIYIFHTDTFNKYSWKEICEDYLVLKRYDLSLYDLKKLNFKVPYPPSPIMRDMKMYPPYEDK